jgi:hypothetical protein
MEDLSSNDSQCRIFSGERSPIIIEATVDSFMMLEASGI